MIVTNAICAPGGRWRREQKPDACSSSASRGLRQRRRRAQAMVEFALIAPVLFAIFLGVFELGRLMAIWVSLQQGAQEAARVGSIKTRSQAQIFQAAQNYTLVVGAGLRDCTPTSAGPWGPPPPISDPAGSCLPTTTTPGGQTSPDGGVVVSCGASPTSGPDSCDTASNRVSNGYARVEITYPFQPVPLVYPFGTLQLQSWAQVRVE